MAFPPQGAAQRRLPPVHPASDASEYGLAENRNCFVVPGEAPQPARQSERLRKHRAGNSLGSPEGYDDEERASIVSHEFVA
jgi:hypothetical protein